MAAPLTLALVGAVPISAQEQERSRLLPFVHQLLQCQLVRRVLQHLTPPASPPVDVVDAATSVTEEDLARAAADRRHGPLPDLVTCGRPAAADGDRAAEPGPEPTPRQLRLRLEQLRAVGRIAQLEGVADPGQEPTASPAPPVPPARHLGAPDEDRQEDGGESEQEEEEEAEEGGQHDAGRRDRLAVGRELAIVASRMDEELVSGSLAQSSTCDQVAASDPQVVPGSHSGLIAAAAVTCALAGVIGIVGRQ